MNIFSIRLSLLKIQQLDFFISRRPYPEYRENAKIKRNDRSEI